MHPQKYPGKQIFSASIRVLSANIRVSVKFTFPNRKIRRISTPRLNALLHVHLEPINVVIFHGSQTIPHLEDGFTLRCFQSLSVPDIATRQCPWQGQPIHQRSSLFGPLVVFSPLTRSTDYIFTLRTSSCSKGLAYYKHRQSFSKKRFLTMQVCS